MSIEGTDWSHWNENPNPDPYSFIIHKATQGTKYVDPTYADRARWIRDLGKVWGAYLFPVTNHREQDQVDHFVDVANIQPGELVALDFEDDDTWRQYTMRALAQMAQACMQALIAAYQNNRVLLYCNRSTYINIVRPYEVNVGDGLWIASPGQEPTMPWAIWQYGHGSVDYDRANFATLAQFTSWAWKETGEEIDMTPEQAEALDEIKQRLRQLHLNGGAPLPDPDNVNNWRAGGDLTALWRSLDDTLIEPLRAELADLRTAVTHLVDQGVQLQGEGSITFTPTTSSPD